MSLQARKVDHGSQRLSVKNGLGPMARVCAPGIQADEAFWDHDDKRQVLGEGSNGGASKTNITGITL